jgi:translation initiation factor IF-3
MQQSYFLLHFSRTGGHEIPEPRVNSAIRAKEVRVVAPDGSQIGVKKVEEALWLADQLGLDLVEVAPDARPPVCRMMDYGKYKYEQSVKQREARKKQTRTVIKEVRLRPRIGTHDFDIVRRRAQDFLSEGDKVKVTVRFRGRENERPELGHKLVERLLEELNDLAIVEQSARKDGRTMTMVMAPTRKALELAAAAKEAKISKPPIDSGDGDDTAATETDGGPNAENEDT